jgi:hypothetical protein
MESPILLAKKQTRDAKRKKLEDAFKHMSHIPELPHVAGEEEEGTAGESSSEMAASSPNNKTKASEFYLKSSYQNNQHLGELDQQNLMSRDVEQGRGSSQEEKKSDGSTTTSYQTTTNSYSLREEVQSLIDNGSEDHRICVNPQKAFLENVGIRSNPQRVFLSILFLFFLWWLL